MEIHCNFLKSEKLGKLLPSGEFIRKVIGMGFWMWSFYLVNPIIIVQKCTNKLENYEVGQYSNTYYQLTKDVFLYSQIKSRCFYLLVGYAAVLYSYFGAQISRPAQIFSTVSPFLSKMSIFIKNVFFFNFQFWKVSFKIDFTCPDAELIILHKYCMSTFYHYERRCNI